MQKYLVSWSYTVKGQAPIEAESPHKAAALLNEASISYRTITGVEFDGKYHGILEWCKTCGNPVFEGEPFAYEAEGIYLCQSCEG